MFKLSMVTPSYFKNISSSNNNKNKCWLMCSRYSVQNSTTSTYTRSNTKSKEHKCMDLLNLQIKKSRSDAYLMEIFGNSTLGLLLSTLVALETQSNPTIGRSPEIVSTWHTITTPLELLAKAQITTKAVQS